MSSLNLELLRNQFDVSIEFDWAVNGLINRDEVHLNNEEDSAQESLHYDASRTYFGKGG